MTSRSSLEPTGVRAGREAEDRESSLAAEDYKLHWSHRITLETDFLPTCRYRNRLGEVICPQSQSQSRASLGSGSSRIFPLRYTGSNCRPHRRSCSHAQAQSFTLRSTRAPYLLSGTRSFKDTHVYTDTRLHAVTDMRTVGVRHALHGHRHKCIHTHSLEPLAALPLSQRPTLSP